MRETPDESLLRQALLIATASIFAPVEKIDLDYPAWLDSYPGEIFPYLSSLKFYSSASFLLTILDC